MQSSVRFTQLTLQRFFLTKQRPSLCSISIHRFLSTSRTYMMAAPPIKFSDEELRSRLTPQQYRVTQGKGTERPFTGELLENKQTGSYNCIVCGAELFNSSTKFDSGSGWPSFYDVAQTGTVTLHEDTSLGMVRMEVTCAKCGSHLGHVFNDGPKPTGQRYCINSCSLSFEKKK